MCRSCIGIEEAQRRLHQVFHSGFADIGSRPEGRQMRAHECRKINNNPCYGKFKGHSAVFRDSCSFCPVRCDIDQIPCNKPDADVREHPEHHGNCGESKAQECQALIAASISQQHRQVAFFFSFINYLPFLLCPNCVPSLISENRLAFSILSQRSSFQGWPQESLGQA